MSVPPQYVNPALANPGGGGGSPTWGQDAGALLQLLGGGYGLYQAGHLQGAAQDVFRQSDPFAGYRPGYGADLLKLIQDPSSVTKLPGYQFQLGQGVGAIDRSAAAPGGKGFGSGGEGADLMTFGQGLASQFYNQQVQTLAQLAGAQFPPANPAAALAGMGGAATGVGASAQYLGQGLPGTLNLLQRLFPGTSGGTPGAADTAGDIGLSYGTSPGLTDPATAGGITSGQPDWMNWGGGGGATDSVSMDPSGGGGGGVDLTGLWGPRAAGGEAATSGGLSTGQAIGAGGQAAGIALDLAQGTPMGYAKAGLGTASLAARYPQIFGADPSAARGLGAGATAANDLLAIYSGVRRGGVTGYGSAAGGATQLAGLALDSPVLQGAGGAVLAPLATYSAIKNWQSGATGSDIMGGASAGAAWGSMFGPEGTLIGAGIGAAVGGISSAFGPGRMDPENINWNAYAAAADKNPRAVAGATPSQNFQALAGIFDSRGSAIPFYGKFGRMGENQFTVSMTGQINSALKSGAIGADATPDQIYSKVVEPWITSMGGKGGWQNTYTSKGASEKDAVGELLTNMIAQWQAGQLTSGTAVGVGGQRISGLPSYGG